MRHSPLVQEHFDNPRRLGPPQGPGPVACGRAGSAAEGARILIEARIVAGRIEAALAATGARLDVIIDIDPGIARTGVASAEAAVALAQAIDRLRG